MITFLMSLQLIATLFMVGIIWFVQIVHYPLFHQVGNSVAYYQEHQKLTTYVVMPPMLTELAVGALLMLLRGSLVDRIGLGLLLLIWLSTLFLQVPLHRRLSQKYEKKWVDRLIFTNWIRTVAWSLRGIFLIGSFS